jgi:predicted component of type VI protein secretion system
LFAANAETTVATVCMVSSMELLVTLVHQLMSCILKVIKMNNPQTYKAFAKFITNEIKPRAELVNKSMNDFLPSAIAFNLIKLEQQGLTFRKQTREVLDYLTDQTKMPSDTTVKILDSAYLMCNMEIAYEAV